VFCFDATFLPPANAARLRQLVVAAPDIDAQTFADLARIFIRRPSASRCMRPPGIRHLKPTLLALQHLTSREVISCPHVFGRHCHVVERRTRKACFSHMFRRPHAAFQVLIAVARKKRYPPSPSPSPSCQPFANFAFDGGNTLSIFGH
jgi:hypothetical protein